jgi:hypothetical protein
MPGKNASSGSISGIKPKEREGNALIFQPQSRSPILKILIGKLTIRNHRNPNKTNEGGHL